jgi:hypothetical protein
LPTISHQSTDKDTREVIKLLKIKMKFFATALFAIVAAEEKKVPPRHPTQRLAKLNVFAAEWINDNLTAKQAENWVGKFDRNVVRMNRRFELCGFYDESLAHGGPSSRKRRSGNDECELGDESCGFAKYNKGEPLVGIKQITRGFSKWAERYIEGCGLQPQTQTARATKWFNQLGQKYMALNSN